MKRQWMILGVAAALTVAVLAAPGDDNDPALSYSYVQQVLEPALVEELSDLGLEALGQSHIQGLRDLTQEIGAFNLEALDGQKQKTQGTVVLKKGDVLNLDVGTQIMVQNGAISLNDQGLVDVTNGKLAATGALVKGTRYMMGDKAGQLTITSDSCQVMLTGVYWVDGSNAVDYGSRAVALQTMGLFRGLDSGFDLEDGATRGQGLVMFLRILGLEDEALAYKGSAPFTDVPKGNWLYPYVAYAYANGLTTGESATKFSPDSPLTAQHYVTFLLRALAYEEGVEFSYATALTDGSALGVFTQAELTACGSGVFHRAQMVYLSYESLFALNQDSCDLVMLQLVADGAMKEADLYDGICQVVGGRIGEK